MEITIREWNELKSIALENNAILKKLDAAQNKELLSPNEVCVMLKISRRTYQRHVESGIIEQIKKGDAANSPVFVKRSEINRLIAEGKI